MPGPRDASMKDPIWLMRMACFFQMVSFSLLWAFEGVWMREQGLGETMIGFIGSAATFVVFISGPMLGKIADRTGQTSRMILVGCIALSICAFLLGFCRSAVSFLALVCLRGMFAPLVFSLMPALAISILGETSKGRGYGLYRIFGSLGFIIATLLFPRLFPEIKYLFWVAGFSFALASLPVILVPPIKKEKGPSGKLITLLRNRPIALFLVATFFFSSASPAVYTFATIYARELGADQEFIGLFASVMGIVALIALPLNGIAVDRFGPRPILWMAFLAQPLRALTLSLCSQYPMLLWAQVFHFFTWAGFETAGVIMMYRFAPERQKVSAQSLFFSTQVLGGFLGSFLAGFLAENFGYPLMFRIFAGVALIGLILFSVFYGRFKRDESLG